MVESGYFDCLEEGIVTAALKDFSIERRNSQQSWQGRPVLKTRPLYFKDLASLIATTEEKPNCRAGINHIIAQTFSFRMALTASPAQSQAEFSAEEITDMPQWKW